MKLRKYSELLAWQKAMDLAVEVYGLTGTFPPEERYGLARQLRECAVSVPSNIAEGQGRKSTREFRRHLSIAIGSLQELETQLLLASRLRFVAPDAAERTISQLSEVGRLTGGLYNSLAPVIDVGVAAAD